MPLFRSVACATLLRLLAGDAVASAAPSPDHPRIALTARLVFAPGTRSACLMHESDPFGGPTNPNCRAAAGERLHEAFEATVRRMFQVVDGGEADLEFAVSLGEASITTLAGGHRVLLQAQVVVRAAPGGELAVLQPRGEWPILGEDRDVIPNATGRAAREAALDLERLLLRSPPVVSWMVARGIDPVGAGLAWAERGRWLAFLDLGGGVLAGGGDASTGAFSARAGVAGRWLVLQGVAGIWRPGFESAPLALGSVHRGADLGAVDVGFEAGPVYRLGSTFEVRAGAGVHLLWGTAEVKNDDPIRPLQSYQFSRVVPSVSGALQLSPRWGGHAGRPRLGLEVRRFLGTTVGFPELSRKIPIADTYLGAFFGVELPWSGRPRQQGAGAP
jgi:hypothetical protein